MDIAAMSMEMSQINLQSQVGTSVLKLAMDSADNSAKQMNGIMENLSVEPGKGKYIDATI